MQRQRHLLQTLLLRKQHGQQQQPHQRPNSLFILFVALLVLQFFINSSVFHDRRIHADSIVGKQHGWKQNALPSSFARTTTTTTTTASDNTNKNDMLGASTAQLHRYLENMGKNTTSGLPWLVQSPWGRTVFNPHAFRTSSLYVNHPLPCKGECVPLSTTQRRRREQRTVPAPGRIVQTAAARGSSSSSEAENADGDVVLAHLFRWGHGSSHALRRFVGSLRRTGYTGHILLGLREDGAEPDDWTFLAEHHVTVYQIDTETCSSSSPQQQKQQHIRSSDTEEECWKGSALPNPAWGLYAMHASWLEAFCTGKTAACKKGRVLSAMDITDVYFQRNPFAHVPSNEPTVLLMEDLAPHTDPLPYDDASKKDSTTVRRHTEWSQQRKTSTTCFPQFSNLLRDRRPVLITLVVLGSAHSIQRYFATTIDYFHLLSQQTDCTMADAKHVVNYLYYSGLYEQTTTTLPWGTGPILPLNRACNNPNLRPSSGQIDLIEVDTVATGFLFNIHTPPTEPWRIPPILVGTKPCTKWMRRYFDLHERFGKAATVSDTNSTTQQQQPTAIGPMLRRAIHWELIEQQQDGGSGSRRKPLLPMKTSYHRATVVQRASWFDRTGYCFDTCCAEPIAVSMDQDADHLITSVDGFDLADVVLLGHDIKNHLVLDVSYMDHAIIPCLQDGTIFYADSEAGGIIRFYEEFRPNLTKPFVMITGRTDGPEPITGRDIGIKAIKTDNLLTRWYGINPCYECGASSEKFAMMHLGLSAAFDHQRYLYDYVAERNFVNPFSGPNKAKFLESKELRVAKDATNLMFVKFGINERSKHRQAPFDMACKNRTSTPKDAVSCSTPEHKFHPSDIYSTAETYLFGLSPPGNGDDCYRTYELLYLGVIPVVKYSPEFAELFKDIPILMLRNWQLTQQELVEQMRNYIYSPEFRNNDFLGWDRLFLKHWRRKVLSDAGRLDEIVEDDMGRPYYQAWTYRPYTPPLTYKDN